MLAIAATMTSASAADMARRMPTKAPAYVEQYYSWTGFYAGVNGGWGFGNSDWSNVAGGNSFDIDGGVAGGTIGYNYQMGRVVLGVEGDMDWSDIRGTTTSVPCLGSSCETRNTWMATARGRIGYAFDRIMPYVTAGGAFGDVSMNAHRPAGSDRHPRRLDRGRRRRVRAHWSVDGQGRISLCRPGQGDLQRGELRRSDECRFHHEHRARRSELPLLIARTDKDRPGAKVPGPFSFGDPD